MNLGIFNANSQPKHRVNSLAGRYAVALFSAACKENALERTHGDVLRCLEATSRNSPFDAAFAFADPTVAAAEKQRLLLRVAMRGTASPLFSSFVGVVAAHRRMPLLGSILRLFDASIRVQTAAIAFTVTSAVPLDGAYQQKLAAVLQSKFAPAASTFEWKVDEGLIGGFIVELGNAATIDMSAASRFNTLSREIKAFAL